MNYQETLAYLFESAPMFQQVGSAGYKEGLWTTYALDEYLGNPHRKYKTIHVGGTNGKGSCSHTLAAIFQSAGYKTGLYTSPHMRDFRERIRINGRPADESYVVDFVEKHHRFFETLSPSFFELTTAMAFNYFAEQEVDIAIVEVGLGGRLDCTNIISPLLSIITNISFDHTQYLGHSLEKIATEKAGIIKSGIPVVIGEATPETKKIFKETAADKHAPIVFSEEQHLLLGKEPDARGGWLYQTSDYPDLYGELGGTYQEKNTNTVLSALQILVDQGYNLSEQAIRNGFAHVVDLTGITGRWQQLGERPTVVCDVGHNYSGVAFIVEQLKRQQYKKLHIVIGMVSDKDISSVLSLLPQEADYYFTKAAIKRAMPEDELKAMGEKLGLIGDSYPTVSEALEAAKKKADAEDFIFVGGSTFVVAEVV